MAGKQQFKIDDVIRAIEQGHTPSGAAKVLSCHADTIRNYARRYKTVKDAILSERRDLVDMAEHGLRTALVNTEAWAIAFTLKTLGKDDGYTERTELTGRDGSDLVINVKVTDDRDED